MTDRHDNRTWQSFLPSSYRWLESAKLTKVSGIDQGSVHGALVIPVASGKSLDFSKTKLPEALTAAISKYCEELGWPGKGELVGLVNGRPVILAPISELAVSPERLLREAGLAVGKILRELKVSALTLVGYGEYSSLSLFDGICQAFYSQQLFKGQAETHDYPETVEFHQDGISEQDVSEAKVMARSLMFTRMLQDAPASWLTPERWAQIAEEHFKSKRVEVNIMGRQELAAHHMGSFLSVAAGSVLEPKLISIKIAGKNTGKKIALIGKGLTFDAGGISLKPSKGMGEMKYDMSGGAAVMGAAHYLADIQPEVDVHFIIGAVENMCSGSATRPGDIVQAANGKTIEVLNTDAEGRLVLADLLCYASESKPDLMIDLATLTGAVLHGLGSAGAAILSDQDHVASYVKAMGQRFGEPFWQLPLWPELKAEVKSDVADLKNIAKANIMAGTIIGGMFLKEFVPDQIPWAHLDIAGTGWNCLATGYPKQGGSGFAVRTLVGICRHFESLAKS